ncbi:V-type ATP synthase, subunit A [Candidatus Protochlamydia naegleriophila]|uniref:V-type ATP synthase alpha chain n=1 Tax=Candidatus Protochlamydia naegleriophila TaxID=389348 RepID=A0A0U5JBN1_9BACT|nr:V-type ATP synthase subunit A [Candidatus Protochlamydia naegleriophila]CUI17272.1 V-type ATP synthase, subunit A [Candidatus Protochlamydia naegleriophila]
MGQVLEIEKEKRAKGKVVKAFGNLLQVRFEGNIRQGEVAMVHVEDVLLKAEVIEIIGNEAKIQVFEDTKGVRLDSPVSFTGDLLEAELGPGLLSSIFDGLQNPLVEVADLSGFFLPKGVYLPALDRKHRWDYEPSAKVGDVLVRGDTLGSTREGRFQHRIMIPFTLFGKYRLTWVIGPGSYNVDTVVAKAVDEAGQEHAFTMVQKWPVKNAMLQGEKIKPTKMMDTGERIIDTQFPLMKGGTFCTPGPFGAGKTVLQHHLSKYADVDIVLFVACGERAGEVVEVLREFPHLIDPHTGETLMKRTVIICNTSSMPVAARESSIYMGITIAEYYRQMGLDVLVLADSTSRWAQALREMSGRLEEIPGEEAFPAYLASRIAEFYERSGVVALRHGKPGSITIGGAVSPAGGNFEEPVTQATLAVVGAFLGLSRSRSDSRRYPAIDPLMSWSKYVDAVGQELSHQVEGWDKMVKRARRILFEGNDIGKRMEVVGEEGIAMGDMLTYLKAELYDFSYLQQNAFDKEDAYCPLKRQIALFELINHIFETDFKFHTHDQAREFFLELQNRIKNMNFVPFESEEYRKAFAHIKGFIEQAHK